MKLFRSKQDARLDQAISELRGEQPDAETLSASAERVWQRLQTGEGAEAASGGLQAIRGCADIRSLLPAFHRHELLPARARIDSIEGQAYLIDAAGERALKRGDEVGEGEFIRTAANSHAKVRLFDGSEVEMNQRAELAVSASRRDTTIHLDQGNIIVQAAKRRTGHLYVSAPDCTVAVTGTAFSVNSGTKGSRVAV